MNTDFERGVDQERRRCQMIVLQEYSYWQDGFPDEIPNVSRMLVDIQIGAGCAAANILARVLGLEPTANRAEIAGKDEA